MTAEQLNIKIKLDIGDVSRDVQKVKQGLSGMADKVKQSLPRIGTESNKASRALKDVKEASDDVKEAIEDIGDEAQDSLTKVTTESNRIKDALKSVRVASTQATAGFNGSAIADSTSQATSSVEELRGAMDAIVGLNFFDLILEHWDKIKGVFSGAKDWNFDVAFIRAKESVQELGKSVKNVLTGNFKDASKYFKQAGKDAKTAFKELKEGIKDVGKGLNDLIPTTAKVVAGITAIVLSTVALTRNALRVSELGEQIYVSAQKAGMSAQQYQEWTYVLERAGIEADELTEVIKTLTEAQIDVLKGAEDFTQAFAQLGISAQEVASMGQAELFERTVAALQNVTDTTQRTAIAYKLFGEDAAKLTTVLNLTNKETAQLVATYNQLGGAMSQELITYSNQLQGSLTNLRAAWQGLKNTLAELVLPTIINIVNWLVKAIAVVNMFIRTIFGITGTAATNNGIDKSSASIGGYTDAVEGATSAVEKLKRTTMGFDELNIVGNPNSSAGGGGGGSAAVGGGTDFTGLGSSDLSGMINTDNLGLEKWQAFFDKFKGTIQLIAGLLATLGISSLLGQLGNAIGLGDKFLGVIKTIKSLAGGLIVITLQYTLMNEWLSDYIDGEGFKNYIKALIAGAIGTGILYSMWGPTGLIIGLGVSVVASISALVENGGITNAESLLVAFTGLGSAIAAIAVAVKKLKGTKFFAALKSGEGVIKSFTAAFPKVSAAISKVIGYVSKFIKFLTAGKILTIAGIIAGIASVVVFLQRNWEEVSNTIKKFFDMHIAPKLEAIQKAFKDMGDAIVNALPPAVRETIVGIVTAIGDWFASVDWLEAIGDVFEWVGGLIFSTVSTIIVPAFSAFMSIVQGAVEVFSGAIQTISGLINFIVSVFRMDFPAAQQAVKDTIDGIVTLFKGLWNMIAGPFISFIEGVNDWFVWLWDELVGHSVVPDMINAIIKWFLSLPGKILTPIKNFVNNILSTFKTLWNNVRDWFNKNIAPKFTKTYWFNKFENIRYSFAYKLDAVKSALSSKWSGIKSWFNKNIAPKFTLSYWSNKFKNIPNGIKSAFNSAIGIVEKAVNAIIKKINTLSWKIPSWVPVFGGQKFGFNFKQISIPRLATGGIATGDTLAHIGEGGFREAVLPLDRNTEWMDQLADKIAARQGGAPTRVALVVDGKELGWATINNINKITKQTGGLQLAL